MVPIGVSSLGAYPINQALTEVPLTCETLAVEWLGGELTMKRIFLSLLLIAGCGNENSGDDPTAGLVIQNECQPNARGTCVSIDNDVDTSFHNSKFYEKTFDVVEGCMRSKFGIATEDGPFVHVINHILPNGKEGFVAWRDGRVTYNASNNQISTLQHEYVHFILLKNNFPNDRNADHDHQAFDEQKGCVRLNVFNWN